MIISLENSKSGFYKENLELRVNKVIIELQILITTFSFYKDVFLGNTVYKFKCGSSRKLSII